MGVTSAFGRDLTTAVVLAVVGTARIPLTMTANRGVVLWQANAVATVELLAIGWRRRAPITALIVATGAVLAAGFLPARYPLGGVGLFVCAYSVGSVLPARRAACALAAGALVHAAGGVAVGLMGGSLGLLLSFWDVSATNVRNVLIASVASYGLPGLIGAFVQTRRAYTAELVARARRLEAERDEKARSAVLEERSHIARELHDVAAHDLSAIVVQAAAADRLLDSDVDGVRTTLAAIRTQGRETLDALRDLVGVVRDDDSDGRTPQPGLDEVDRLVTAARNAGATITLAVSGTPVDSGPAVELAAFRVLQEALANARRHAPDAKVDVTVAHTADAVRVAVTDDGAPAGTARVTGATSRTHDATSASGAASVALDENGHGLIGMRERVQQAGGQLIVGPVPDGGWQVVASFPTAPTP